MDAWFDNASMDCSEKVNKFTGISQKFDRIETL